MDLKNCPECGKLFVFRSRNLCPECIEKEETFFQEVERYLKAHPGATIPEVARNTSVPEEKIIAFLKDGRLIASGDGMLIKCERCGRRITSGRFCDECRIALSKTLTSTIAIQRQAQKDEPSTIHKSRMYTADIRRKNLDD